MFKAAVLSVIALAAAVPACDAAAADFGERRSTAQTLGSSMLRTTKHLSGTEEHMSNLPLSINSRHLLGQGISTKCLVKDKGIDTRGSKKPYGNCNGVSPGMASSSWCQKGAVSGWPTNPKLKYGRQTIYGSGGRGWCGKDLAAEGDVVPIALSTKYVPQEATSPDCPYCGQCLCIRTRGADLISNPTPPAGASSCYGRVYKGKVMDQCPECCADCIDTMACDPYFNAVSQDMAYGVGVWTVEWNFVKCDTDCNKFFKGK